MSRMSCGPLTILLLLAMVAPEGARGAASGPPWFDPHARFEGRSVESPAFEPVAPQGSLTGAPPMPDVVDRDVLNLRALLGGGRKIIRHDCAPWSDYLSVVYSRDVGRPDLTLWNAQSDDNGHGWSLVGPLSFDPLRFRDRSHCIGFGDLAIIGYQEADFAGFSQSRNFLTKDSFPCLQDFSTPTQISDDSMRLNEYFLQQVVTPLNGSYAVYWSFIDFNAGDPYTTYFRRSTDGGVTWSDYYDFTAMAVPDGFEMRGMDGPLSMDAEGEFIAALVPVALDPAWAKAHGFRDDFAYPGYSQSTDGGVTWSPVELVRGTDPSAYPHGHSGDPGFDQQIHYVGGMGYGIPFTAFNNIQDNVAVTSDGLVHLTYQLEDVTFGYEGVFHTVVDQGTFRHAYVGFPETPGGINTANFPSIAKTDRGDVVIGWTEFMPPAAAGDICYNAVPAGRVAGMGPVNASQSPGDETYQRIVDRAVPYAAGSDSFYVDWLFQYYGYGGDAADSTLWHLQAVVHIPDEAVGLGIEPDTVVVPRGGVVGLTATAVNRTEESLVLQAWSEVRLPDGHLLTPFEMNDDLHFAPGETIVKRIENDVPPDAPPGGPYTYFVKIGAFPDSVIVEDSFDFAIVPAD